jgi:arsenite methyltransferase
LTTTQFDPDEKAAGTAFGARYGLYELLAAGAVSAREVSDWSGLPASEVAGWLARQEAAGCVVRDTRGRYRCWSPIGLEGRTRRHNAIPADAREDAMTTRVTAANVDREKLRINIRDKYTEVATEPEKGFHFHTGRPLARMLGYPAERIDRLPASTVDSFAGTGNPFECGPLQPGETVLDLGCGAGFDALQAALDVGPAGRVIGIDMTSAMLEKARAAADQLGLKNLDLRQGYLEELPVDDASVDVVISNGVLNLTPDKECVVREIHRVLKPGGRFQVGDIIVHLDVPQTAKDNVDLWSSCIAGALTKDEWGWLLDRAGFTDVRWGTETDVYSGSKHESDAAAFETRGVTFGGRKPS